MRRIINSTNVSLDGVIGPLERWHFEYFDEATNIAADQLFASDALLMGRLTYQGFADVWPHQTGDFADRINSISTYVASTTLQSPDWINSTVITGDLVEEVTRLKQQPGQDIVMYGYGPVAQTLLQHGLLDEVRLSIHPVFVGTGSPSDQLFREGAVSKVTLVDNKTLGSGVVTGRPTTPAEEHDRTRTEGERS